jgi:galactokinase
VNDVRETARAAFVEWTGRRPDGLWSAPGRANLIGEHTDYNEGFALPFAIDRRVVAAVGTRDDDLVRVASVSEDAVAELALSEIAALVASGGVTGWPAYPLGVVWALGETGAGLADVPGVDILLDSTVPVGAGLSSSAAVESAVAVALDELWGLGLSRRTLVDVGHRAENDVVGAPTGILDQTASLFGRRATAVLIDCRTRATRHIPFDLETAGLAILVIDTGVAHGNAGPGGYRQRRASCEAAAAALGVASLRDVTIAGLARERSALDDRTFRRARHVVTENERVLATTEALAESGPAAIGDLLLASHASMRDDFEISTAELDLAVEAAVGAGALGARMTGGGFGGSAIALVARAELSHVEGAVATAFAEHGYSPPDVFPVVASDGAGRDPEEG